MSYRSFKRVLGETHLELKCLFLFGVSLLILLTGSLLLYLELTKKLVYREYRNTGELLVSQLMYTEHWKALETNEAFAPLVDKLTEKLSEREYDGRFIRVDGTDETKVAHDEFEYALLDEFVLAGPANDLEVDQPRFKERPPENNQYRYYQAIYANAQSCVTCHNALEQDGGMALGGGVSSRRAPLVEGDLMAIAKITIPSGPIQKALSWNRAILLSISIVTVFIAMVSFYMTIRYVIVKPLRHLRDVSDEISHGNISLRADIHTGDEFESLAVAFNRMLRNLVSVQEDLRDVNADLDAKVDELAQVNMRLYEMNAVKSDFLATMSHELRTPLNSILGFSEVLESVESLNDQQKRYVQNIRKSGSVLLEMINDILDLAKMESGKMDTRLSDFQIEQIVSAQCDMARPLAEKKNIDLNHDVAKELPPLHQDQARVQQILNNLLSNAIKFTPEGGRIVVGVDADDDGSMVMRITDTGVGIADDDQQTIFEKFRQARGGDHGASDAMTREYSGTGLGLSIVKELCRLLGGEISVESELGKGSTFTVRLPWQLQEQPRLDSALAEGFEVFSRPKLELPLLNKPDGDGDTRDRVAEA
jgi:two-component system sensor histidine kinase BarA